MDYKLKNGAVVAVSKGIIEHVGILARHADFGYPTVISNSKKYGKVVEEPLADFTQGQELRVKGYIGNLKPFNVVGNARSYIDEKYNLLQNNCEHLVTKAHGRVKESPQLKFWMVVGFILAIWAWLSKR